MSIRFWLALALVLAAIFGATQAFADDESGKAPAAQQDQAKSGCAGDKSAAKATCDPSKCTMAKAQCEVAGKVVNYEMPAMAYKVGEKQLACPIAAEELAKKNDSSIKFVVGDKTFESKDEAFEAYAQVLDSFLSERVMSVRYAVGDDVVSCPMAAQFLAAKNKAKVQYRLASFTYADQAAADKALAAAREAVDGAKPDCAATCSAKGEKGGSCCSKAKDVAKSAGDETKGKTVAQSAGAGSKAEGGSADSKAGCAGSGGASVAKAGCCQKDKGTNVVCCKSAEGKVALAKARILAAMKALASSTGA